MRINIATYRRSLILLLVLSLIVVGSPFRASADDFEDLKVWTTVGSAGTVDEESLSVVSLNGPFVAVRTTAVLPATVTIRYNVTAVDSLVVGGGSCFEVRWRDNGSGGQVIVSLKRFNFATGAIATLTVLDSNTSDPQPGLWGGGACVAFARPSSNASSPSATSPSNFNFDHNAYYVEAQIIKTAFGSNAALASVKLRTF